MSEPLDHLAQLNIAKAKAPLESPLLEDFRQMLDPINELADAAPGFVWRLRDEDSNDATSIPFPGAGKDTIVNLSVWRTAEDLWSFVYDSAHLSVMRRRREWFERTQTYMCLWWIPAGTIPTVEEAKRRLDLLSANGPTPAAFTFKQRFNSAGTPLVGVPRP
jgi:hypothetical protein